MIEGRELMVFYENMLALNNVSIQCEEAKSLVSLGPIARGRVPSCMPYPALSSTSEKRRRCAAASGYRYLANLFFNGEDISRTKAPSPRKGGHCPLSGEKEDLSGKLCARKFEDRRLSVNKAGNEGYHCKASFRRRWANRAR